MNIRETIEEREKQFLSPHAQLSRKTRGREIPEDPGSLRTVYQHDRDRIIHCKSFRRLKHKTQVFLAPEGDHYRTRLTHTLEVSQIARTVSRALSLNEDLTEAIALGHDLGHTPFGHTGEDAFTKESVGWQFEHNKQSKRVVEKLERGGRGLNLTWEVRDGIEKHVEEEIPATLEGRVVRLADRIAYINHDIDDAIRAGIIKRAEDLPKDAIATLGETGGARINTMVTDMVEQSEDKDDIKMSSAVYEAMEGLKDYLYDHVYVGSQAKIEEQKAIALLRQLYGYYLEHPDELPESPAGEKDLSVRIVDYIAGMSDRYVLKEFERIFLPRAWEE